MGGQSSVSPPAGRPVRTGAADPPPTGLAPPLGFAHPDAPPGGRGAPSTVTREAVQPGRTRSSAPGGPRCGPLVSPPASNYLGVVVSSADGSNPKNSQGFYKSTRRRISSGTPSKM